MKPSFSVMWTTSEKYLGVKYKYNDTQYVLLLLSQDTSLWKVFQSKLKLIEDSKHSSSKQQWFIFLEIELHSPSLWWTKRNPSSESEAQMSFAYKYSTIIFLSL